MSSKAVKLTKKDKRMIRDMINKGKLSETFKMRQNLTTNELARIYAENSRSK